MTMNTKIDYYDVLRVREDATPAELHAAYRRQLNTHHPDRGGSTVDAQQINEAYTVLSDQAARAAYDSARHRAATPTMTMQPPAPARPAPAAAPAPSDAIPGTRLPEQSVFMIRVLRAVATAGKTVFMIGWILLGLFLGFVGLLIFTYGLNHETARAWSPLLNIGGVVLAVLWVMVPIRVNKALTEYNVRANEDVQREYGSAH